MTLVPAEVARSTKSVMGSKKIKLGKYRHFKGGLYEVLCVAKNSENLREKFVVYRSFKYKHVLIRPKKMFLESVKVNGKKVPRFEYIGE